MWVCIIISITASLSSNTYNKASWRADWTFEGTASMSFITSILLWDLWCLWSSLSGFTNRSETWEIFPKTETIRSHSSRAGKPSSLNPVSREIISDSVELWETDVCFLHIQLIGTNVWLPKTHNVPPEVDFESSRSPAKSESWNSPSLHCLAVFTTWQFCLYSLVWWIYEINRFRRLSQALDHFVIDRASFFTDHRISGRPIRAKYKHFRTIWTFAGVKPPCPTHWSLFEIACVCESCEVESKFHLCLQRVSPFYHGSESCFQCVGVGFVRRPHLLVGGIHSVTTYPRGSWRAAGSAGDWRRIRGVGSWMERRTQRRRVTLTSCADEMSANTRTTWATRCGVQWVSMTTTRTNKKTTCTFTCQVWRFMCFVLVLVFTRRHWCRTSCRSVSPRIRKSKFSSWSCSRTLSCHRQLRL